MRIISHRQQHAMKNPNNVENRTHNRRFQMQRRRPLRTPRRQDLILINCQGFDEVVLKYVEIAF
jgi:hypothetical protein